MTNCFFFPTAVLRCFSTLFELFYFKLFVYVCPLVSLKPPLYLSLPSRSCHSDLSDGFCFCCVPMSFRRKRTRRCCRPRCRASGRTTSGCRRSRRAQWLASSKSPSCCAMSTSPVSFTTAHTNTQISRKMQIVQRACAHSILILFSKADTHTHTHTYPLQSVYYHSLDP